MIKFGLISRAALLVVCVEVVAFSLLGWFYINQFSTAADENIRSRLHLVGRMIANEELTVSSIARKSLVADLIGAPYLDGMVVGGNGRVIVSSNPSYLGRLAAEVPGFDTRWIADFSPDEQFIAGDNTVTGIAHIHSAVGGSAIYYTVITVSTAELNAQKRSIVLLGIAGSALFILLSSAAIVLIAQRLITRRVDTSLSTLKKVEEGDLDARIPVTSHDELGQLQQGINSMTEKVGALLNQLRRLNESLELRVQEEVAKNREKDAMLIQQSRLAAMGEMMHNIAHQWRQPLSTLSVILSNIKDDFDWGEMTRERLERQVGNGIALTQKMSTTIDDFRDFFRPDHAVTRFSLKDSIHEALNLVGATLHNNQIEVVVEAPEDIFVNGYANEFSQVLLNILANAKDALVRREGNRAVTISASRDAGMGEVRIRDNGGGIPEENLPKIFDPYFTTKESGSGIGLYMSRMIMSHMHGQITARNAEGGAEFVVSVPIAGGE